MVINVWTERSNLMAQRHALLLDASPFTMPAVRLRPIPRELNIAMSFRQCNHRYYGHYGNRHEVCRICALYHTTPDDLRVYVDSNVLTVQILYNANYREPDDTRVSLHALDQYIKRIIIAEALDVSLLRFYNALYNYQDLGYTLKCQIQTTLG